MKLAKELRRYTALAKDQGFTVIEKTRHVQFLAPTGGGIVTVACTPSDYRAYMNIRADLRRIGMVVER